LITRLGGHNRRRLPQPDPGPVELDSDLLELGVGLLAPDAGLVALITLAGGGRGGLLGVLACTCRDAREIAPCS